MLKRYWFVFFPEWRFGPWNAGVTATSVEEAKDLLLTRLSKIDYTIQLDRLRTGKKVEVIEDIDINMLDNKRVLSNLERVCFKGVWFPKPKNKSERN